MTGPTRSHDGSDEPLRLPSDRDSTGRHFGDEELQNLREVLASGKLNATGGPFTERFEGHFAEAIGTRHAAAVNSGSAAVHTALGALGLRPGDEVVTTSITDMGAILPISYEGAHLVFADVDPSTGNVAPESIQDALSPATRAVIVTHLFGQMAETRAIVELCQSRGIIVIEDAAQAFLATEDGHGAGTLGAIGCFSFQQGKHMTTGEGGAIVTDDADLLDRCRRFLNKGWGYGDARPDHDRPGLNHRWTELQAAVADAQLERLESVVARRRERAAQFHDAIAGIEGIRANEVRTGTEHSYWRFPIHVDRTKIPGGPDAVAAALRPLGVGAAPRYIRKPAFECAVFEETRCFGSVCGRAQGAVKSGPETLPGTYAFLESVLVLPWNEHLTEEQVRGLATAIERACWSAAEAEVAT